ncbi:MAG TPA: SMP-30/gluconolactonase/LRE family protein [Bryobacteraceae bacterium]|nr:SMP-30/gluconolactonase/LRE family protein [Bryobacteraceae bacterium]
MSDSNFSRRRWLSTLAAGAGALAISKGSGQTARDWSGKEPIRYPDPDVIALDSRFKKYSINSANIQRVATGMRWAEGPAWNGAGNYLIWSDIPNDRQMRWLEENGEVTVFRHPCSYSNGNTFDWNARQLSCEHQARRVVRYEQTGEVTVLADRFEGKPLNAPNDIVVHPNGDIWFTDPGYGQTSLYEGGRHPLEIKEAVYRIDGKTGKIVKITDELYKPNGLCFSPDFKKLYICDTGATNYPQAPKEIRVYDVSDDEKSLRNSKRFISTELAGKGAGLADGIRADRDGNIWAGCGWVGPGYDGVHVFAPDGVRIGVILLPEVPANLCFGGTKRNRLFIAASQSIYSLYTEAQGANIC